MRRIAIVFVLVLSVFVAAAPARANDSRNFGSASPSSVFPVPRDPWRSWGAPRDLPQLRHELPQRVGPPRAPRRAFVERAPVWMPGQWVWDGDAWAWWPGGWVR